MKTPTRIAFIGTLLIVIAHLFYALSDHRYFLMVYEIPLGVRFFFDLFNLMGWMGILFFIFSLFRYQKGMVYEKKIRISEKALVRAQKWHFVIKGAIFTIGLIGFFIGSAVLVSLMKGDHVSSNGYILRMGISVYFVTIVSCFFLWFTRNIPYITSNPIEDEEERKGNRND